MIVDTATNGWTRVGTLGWRKSLRDKHWAQIVKDPLGWAWTIHKADPTTMCPITVAGSVADGLDISLAAAKDDVDHWARNYHRHAVVVRRVAHQGAPYWWSYCRIHETWGPYSALTQSLPEAVTLATLSSNVHRDCEAAWQRGER